MSTIRKVKLKSFKEGRYEVRLEEYKSANEMVNDLKHRPITDSSFKDKSQDSFGSWEGVNSYEEALNLLSNGYQPVVDKLKDKLKVSKVGDGKRISFKNDIVGYAPVVPLALKGVPQSMINMSQKAIKCKVIDVYYNISVTCGYDSEDIIKAGSQVLSTILDLEMQGYRFNLYSIQDYSGEKNTDMVCVKIKSSNQPIDIKRISFPLTHTAFFRVIGFDWYSRFPEGTYRSGYGHNLCMECGEEKLQPIAEELFGSNAIYIGAKQIIDNDFSEEYVKGVLLNAGKNNK